MIDDIIRISRLESLKRMGSLGGVADLSELEGFYVNATLSAAPGERLCCNILQIISLYEVELREFTEPQKF